MALKQKGPTSCEPFPSSFVVIIPPLQQVQNQHPL